MRLKLNSITLYFLLVSLCTPLVYSSDTTIINVIDDSGKNITLEKPATRVISLAPHLSEMVYFLEKEKILIARDIASDYPEEIKKVPSIGNASSLNIESIITLKPDLILAWKSGNTQKQILQLEKLGIPIFYSEPRTLQDITSNLERLAILFGENEKLKKKITDLENKFLEKDTLTQPSNIMVFYQVWQSPLMTLNGEHLVSQIIQQCGGENIFASQTILAPQVNIEAVLNSNPDLIIYGEENVQALDFWHQWPEINAVKNKNFLAINPDILVRAGPRIIQGLEQICTAIDETLQKKAR